MVLLGQAMRRLSLEPALDGHDVDRNQQAHQDRRDDHGRRHAQVAASTTTGDGDGGDDLAKVETANRVEPPARRDRPRPARRRSPRRPAPEGGRLVCRVRSDPSPPRAPR
jgi:hypothetical protein